MVKIYTWQLEEFGRAGAKNCLRN